MTSDLHFPNLPLEPSSPNHQTVILSQYVEPEILTELITAMISKQKGLPKIIKSEEFCWKNEVRAISSKGRSKLILSKSAEVTRVGDFGDGDGDSEQQL